jgi:hypothetical protein
MGLLIRIRTGKRDPVMKKFPQKWKNEDFMFGEFFVWLEASPGASVHWMG